LHARPAKHAFAPTSAANPQGRPRALTCRARSRVRRCPDRKRSVNAAVAAACSAKPPSEVTGCQHIEFILGEIHASLDPEDCRRLDQFSKAHHDAFADAVARANVIHTLGRISEQSETIARLVREGRIAVVGAMYDVATGSIQFLEKQAHQVPRVPLSAAPDTAQTRRASEGGDPNPR
jgi:hypothetical protein